MLSGASWSAAAIAGTAVFRIVVSSDSMKKATAISHGSSRLLESASGGCDTRVSIGPDALKSNPTGTLPRRESSTHLVYALHRSAGRTSWTRLSFRNRVSVRLAAECTSSCSFPSKPRHRHQNIDYTDSPPRLISILEGTRSRGLSGFSRRLFELLRFTGAGCQSPRQIKVCAPALDY